MSPTSNPFNLPRLMSGSLRDYAPAQGGDANRWGPVHSGNFDIAPQGAAAVAREYSVTAGHCIALAFNVTDRNQLADYFSNAASRNNTTQELIEAVITSDVEGQHVIAKYAGRDTGTDQPFGHYCSEHTTHQQNGVTHKLPNGTYFLWLKAADNSAFKIALNHQESNKV